MQHILNAMQTNSKNQVTRAFEINCIFFVFFNKMKQQLLWEQSRDLIVLILFVTMVSHTSRGLSVLTVFVSMVSHTLKEMTHGMAHISWPTPIKVQNVDTSDVCLMQPQLPPSIALASVYYTTCLPFLSVPMIKVATWEYIFSPLKKNGSGLTNRW